MKTINWFVLILMVNTSICFGQSENKIYFGVEGGYSFSNSVNLHPQQNSNCVEIEGVNGCWLNTHQSFASTIGESQVFGLKIGYVFNPFLKMDLAYDQRKSFSWSKKFPGDNSGAPNTSSVPRSRSINNISNQTILTNLYFIPFFQNCFLQPYINIGVGWGWNKLGDLQSINLINHNRAVITSGNTQSLVWQTGIGLSMNCYKHWAIDFGYRYVNLGKFRSGTRDIFANVNQPIAPLLANNVTTQELLLGINYLL